MQDAVGQSCIDASHVDVHHHRFLIHDETGTPKRGDTRCEHEPTSHTGHSFPLASSFGSVLFVCIFVFASTSHVSIFSENSENPGKKHTPVKDALKPAFQELCLRVTNEEGLNFLGWNQFGCALMSGAISRLIPDDAEECMAKRPIMECLEDVLLKPKGQ